jgi:hypothetical protein
MVSQYLMRDDAPRSQGYRYRGFESGLRKHNGKKKPSYKAFPNPLAAERYGKRDVLWGLIRPQPTTTKVTIQVRRKGSKKWSKLKSLTTTARGVYGLTARHRKGQQFRVRWTSTTGHRHTGPPVRSY